MRAIPPEHQAVMTAAAHAAAALPALADAARRDAAVFAQFVMRDENTGLPIQLAPIHVEWHDLMDQHDRLVLWSATELGKTTHFSIARALYEIGRNPNIRILIVSDAADRAKKIVKAIKTYIERSSEYRMVFPHVQPDKSITSGLWQEGAFNVKRSTMSKDPTVQVVGFEGSILGARVDLVIVDDYLTPENTYSDRMRDKGYGWLKAVIEGRKTAAARLWFVGNAWHRDDAMHRYAAEPGTVSKKYPVRDQFGVSAWPAVWPTERIEEEIRNRGPIESRRSMFCDPVSDAERRFKEAYIVRALQLGDGWDVVPELAYVPMGWRTITGVDLAVKKADSADETALTTIALDKQENRRVLEVIAGRMDGPMIVDKIVDIHRRLHSIIIVESNAAQDYIRQFTNRQYAVPIKAFHTGKNKVDPTFGLESLAVEMSQGKWAFPNYGGILAGRMHPEIKRLINECLAYDPQSHTGDRLMSLWLAREGARMSVGGAEVGKRPRRT